MRSIEINGKTIELAGSSLAPLTWYRAFGDDGLYDALLAAEPHPGGTMPMLGILRLAWVMAHDADVAAGRTTEAFDAWVASLGEVDFMALRDSVVMEATASFFPGLAKAAQERAKSRKRAAKGDSAGEREGDGA